MHFARELLPPPPPACSIRCSGTDALLVVAPTAASSPGSATTCPHQPRTASSAPEGKLLAPAFVDPHGAPAHARPRGRGDDRRPARRRRRPAATARSSPRRPQDDPVIDSGGRARLAQSPPPARPPRRQLAFSAAISVANRRRADRDRASSPTPSCGLLTDDGRPVGVGADAASAPEQTRRRLLDGVCSVGLRSRATRWSPEGEVSAQLGLHRPPVGGREPDGRARPGARRLRAAGRSTVTSARESVDALRGAREGAHRGQCRLGHADHPRAHARGPPLEHANLSPAAAPWICGCACTHRRRRRPRRRTPGTRRRCRWSGRAVGGHRTGECLSRALHAPRSAGPRPRGRPARSACRRAGPHPLAWTSRQSRSARPRTFVLIDPETEWTVPARAPRTPGSSVGPRGWVAFG